MRLEHVMCYRCSSEGAAVAVPRAPGVLQSTRLCVGACDVRLRLPAVLVRSGGGVGWVECAGLQSAEYRPCPLPPAGSCRRPRYRTAQRCRSGTTASYHTCTMALIYSRS